MSSFCTYCDQEVRPRQQAIQCDRCMRWQHRTCQSGICLADYRKMVKGTLDLEWNCCVCNQTQSSSDSETDITLSPTIVPDTPIRCLPLCEQRPELTIPQTPVPVQRIRPVPAPRRKLDLLPSSSETPLPRPVPAPRRKQLPAAVSTSETPQTPTEMAPRPLPAPRPSSPQTPPEMAPRRLPPPRPSSPQTTPEMAPRPLPAPRPSSPQTPPEMAPRPLPPPAPLMTSHIIHESLEESFQDMCIDDNADLQFEILPKASRSNKDILVDDRGYTYTLKRTVPNGRDWQCAVRQKTLYCSATVKQRGETFTFGKNQHCHEGAPGVATSKRITAKVKEDSLNNVFVSAGTIAEKVLFAIGDVDLPPACRPNLSNLVRIANRTREKLRPQEPQDCDFEIAPGYIPDGFLRSNIRHEGQRHLLFATDEQLTELADVQTWYIDGTFKVAKAPFVQLFSIHGFLGDEQKQVPLLFAMMSRRQTSDYLKVFDALLAILPRRASVQTIYADFEKAAWAAARQALQGVAIHGCHFHWSQAIWRHVQEIGLQVTKFYLQFNFRVPRQVEI